MINHLRRQKAWSEKTFGKGFRLEGIIDHIQKELQEIREKPTDVEEWADLIILALDGAWRSGASAESIIAMIEMKQKKNEARRWPDYRNYGVDEAIQHIKEVPENSYERGTILRYGEGSTALMRVDDVKLAGGEIRYYGRQCMGGYCGAYHHDCRLADDDDVSVYRLHLNGDRNV